MSRLHPKPAQEIRSRPARKEQNRQPQRHHPHDREIREIHVLDHPVAQNVQLRTDRRGHFFLPGEMPTGSTKAHSPDGQPPRRKVPPPPAPKKPPPKKPT